MMIFDGKSSKIMKNCGNPRFSKLLKTTSSGNSVLKSYKGVRYKCFKSKKQLFFRIPPPIPIIQGPGVRSAILTICKGNQRICDKNDEILMEKRQKSRKIADIPDFQNFLKQPLAGTVYIKTVMPCSVKRLITRKRAWNLFRYYVYTPWNTPLT